MVNNLRRLFASNIYVRQGESLQDAIDRAWPGATIWVEPGVYNRITLLDMSITAVLARYARLYPVPVALALTLLIIYAPALLLTVPFAVLPWAIAVMPSYVTVRPAVQDSLLPDDNQRINPSYSPQLIKITTDDVSISPIRTNMLACFWRIIGVEIGPTGFDRVQITVEDPTNTSINTFPHHIIFDRCYLHGNNTQWRGITFHCAYGWIINCWIDGVFQQGRQSMAIWYNGPGPYVTENNYLSGAAETIITGGSDPAIDGVIPSDMVFRHNYFTKDPSWRGLSGSVANVFEFKSAQRALVEYNVMEHSWTDIQSGYVLMLTVRNQDGAAPWTTVKDIEIRYNVLRHGRGAVDILAKDNFAATRSSTVVSSTAANPTVITVSGGGGHSYLTGDVVTISGHSNANVNGTRAITRLSKTTFSMAVLGGGTGGTANGPRSSVRADNINIHHNLFYNIDNVGMLLIEAPQNLKFEHNTMLGLGPWWQQFLFFSDAPGTYPNMDGFIFRNNIVSEGEYGITNQDSTSGIAGFNEHAVGHIFTANLIMRGGVRFVNYGSNQVIIDPPMPMYGPYRLLNPSIVTTTDGEPVGANIDALFQNIPGLVIDSLGGTAEENALPVIPDAYGPGIMTRAAYGGGTTPTVHVVTNLNNSGAGSLRAAMEASGPRVVIFETSGTIDLLTNITVTSPYLTVAGQTAPSPGITLKGSASAAANAGGIVITTHNVLIQHLRVRPGDTGPVGSGETDHLGLYCNGSGCYNIVFDHVSVTWAGNMNSYVRQTGNPSNILFWRCLNAEALYQPTNAPHSSGISSTATYNYFNANTIGAVGYIGCLFAHNAMRNLEGTHAANMQIINSVFYDWGNRGTVSNNGPWAIFMFGWLAGAWKINVIGCQFISGPEAAISGPLWGVAAYSGAAGSQAYVTDNVIDATLQPVSEYKMQGMGFDPRVQVPALDITDYDIVPGAQAQTLVLANVGARPADRDSVDVRIVNDVFNKTGAPIASQTAVGGWPTLAVNARALTLPLNPHSDSGDGYTNLEKWLQGYASGVEQSVSSPTIANAAGSVFVSDNFSVGSSGAALTTRTGQTGATWTLQSGSDTNGVLVLSNAQRVRVNVNDRTCLVYASGTPASDQYDVVADFFVYSVIPTTHIGIWARIPGSGLNGIHLRYLADGWYLRSISGGVVTTIGSHLQNLVAGQTYTVRLQVRNGAVGVKVNGVSVIHTTASVVTGPGRVGISAFANVAGPVDTNTTGIHLDNFQAINV